MPVGIMGIGQNPKGQPQALGRRDMKDLIWEVTFYCALGLVIGGVLYVLLTAGKNVWNF